MANNLTGIHHDVTADGVIKGEGLPVWTDGEHALADTCSTLVRDTVVVFVMKVGKHQFTNVGFGVRLLS